MSREARRRSRRTLKRKARFERQSQCKARHAGTPAGRNLRRRAQRRYESKGGKLTAALGEYEWQELV